MFMTIVAATDGSPHGDRALALAESMAREAKAQLAVVHVVELVGGKGGVYPAAADEPEIRENIEAQVEKLRANGVDASLDVRRIRLGGPAHEIADAAAALEADLIVVGSRGRSPVSEVLLGSVPIRLLHIAHRPVLVVPPAG
ncbi:MAG TPA: universal stress protein [Jatrophihabitantaceae bacterium]|jgi:nucleotide-binding universal stress UspA family protein